MMGDGFRQGYGQFPDEENGPFSWQGQKDMFMGVHGVSDAIARNAQAQAALMESAQKTASFDRLKLLRTRFQEIIGNMSGSAENAFSVGAESEAAKRGSSVTANALAPNMDVFALGQALDRAKAQQDLQLAAILGFVGVPLAGPSTGNIVGQAGDNIASKILSGFGMDIQGAGGNTGLTQGNSIIGGSSRNTGSSGGMTGLSGMGLSMFGG